MEENILIIINIKSPLNKRVSHQLSSRVAFLYMFVSTLAFIILWILNITYIFVLSIVLKQSGRRDVSFPNQAPQYTVPPPPGPTLPNTEAPGSVPQPNISQWLTRQLLPDRPPGMSPATFTATAIEAIVSQQAAFQEQIKQSEANLNAQHAVIFRFVCLFIK